MNDDAQSGEPADESAAADPPGTDGQASGPRLDETLVRLAQLRASPYGPDIAAAADLAELATSFPDDSPEWNPASRGMVFEALAANARWAQAAGLADAVLWDRPANAQLAIVALRALLRAGGGRAQAAVAALVDARKGLSPQDLSSLGHAFGQEGFREAAAILADELSHRRPADPSTYVGAMRAWLTASNARSAADIAERAVAAGVLNRDVRMMALEILVTEGRWEPAAAIAEQACSDAAGDHRLVGMALTALRRVGREAEAREIAERSLQSPIGERYRSALTGELEYFLTYYDPSPRQAVLPFTMLGSPALLSGPVLNTDSKGYRYTVLADGRRFAPADDPDRLGNAVVLGNSAAFGVGASADSQTFPSLLSDDEHRYYNLALRAGSSAQNILSLAYELRNLAPVRRIVVLGGFIELSSAFYFPFLPVNMGAYFGWARVNQLTNPILTSYPPEDWPAAVRPHFAACAATPADRLAIAADQLDRALHALRRFADGLEAEILFVMQPLLELVDRTQPEEELRFLEIFDGESSTRDEAAAFFREQGPIFTDLCRRSCHAHGVRWIDANEILGGSPRRNEWLFSSSAHLTDFGMRLLTYAMRQELRGPPPAPRGHSG